MVFLLFRSRKSTQDLLRENHRSINRAIRELDRERLALETQERNYIAMAKKAAKSGHISTVKTLTKDTVLVRSQINKFFQLRMQLQAVSLRLQTLKSTQAISSVMTGVTKAIKMANRETNADLLTKMLQDFEQQNIVMGIKEESLQDTIDSMVSTQMEEGSEEDPEVAANELMKQILDEAGVTLTEQLKPVPLTPVYSQTTKAEVAPLAAGYSQVTTELNRKESSDPPEDIDLELEARLQRLKK